MSVEFDHIIRNACLSINYIIILCYTCRYLYVVNCPFEEAMIN